MKFTPEARVEIQRRAIAGMEIGLYTRLDGGQPVEPVAPGYMRMATDDWQVDADGRAVLKARLFVFLGAADAPIAGYFARWKSGAVALREAFPAPIEITQMGDRIEVEITLDPPVMPMTEE